MLKSVALVVASLSVLATVAHADPGPETAAPGTQAPAPTPPPQTDDWSNVSHINGTPVKVGERNDYLLSYKKMNVSIDPLSPFFGYFEGAVSVAVSRNVAITGAGAGWSMSGNQTGYQVTASAPIYFRRVFSGPFVEPGVIVRSSTECSTCMADAWAGPEMLVGWHWNFDSGLNMSTAFGLAKHIGDANDNGGDGVDFNAYLRVGYNY